MGIADRDYVRTQRPSHVATMHVWSITTWIIVINVVVFVINNVMTRPYVVMDPATGQRFLVPPVFERLGAFTVIDAIYHLQIWRFITFQFLHANFMHILFNMFALYFFGPLIEEYLGRRRFLAFYLLCGIGGGVMYVILWAMGFFGRGQEAAYTSLVGASAGIFGVLIAAATIAPDATVLIYGSIPAKLKTLAWILIAFALFTIFSGGGNSGGEAAHLGGAVVGFFLIRKPRLLNVFEIGFANRPRRFR